MRKYILLLALCLPTSSFASVNAAQVNEKNVYLGEAYYYAYQGKYLDAIARLDRGHEKYFGMNKSGIDPFHYQFGGAQFSLGDFEASYRMPLRATTVFKSIYDSNSDPVVRNEAAYNLARISMRKGDAAAAMQYISRIAGKVPATIRDDVIFLRAQIYMANGKFMEAVDPLNDLQGSDMYKGFATYNLGVALIKSGQEKKGVEQVEKVASISSKDSVTVAIKDKANLMLGYRLLDSKQPALAKTYLARVDVNGPFSSKALLGQGWAEMNLGNFESAIVPWSVLTKRKLDDEFVQEGMLGVPYAYAKLNLPGKAALLYEKALDGFEVEMGNLDGMIRSVRDRRYFQVLLYREFKQGKDWTAKLRSLPKTPETGYLIDMMENGEFKNVLESYLDLGELSRQLKAWDEDPNSTLARLDHTASRNLAEYGDQVRQLKQRVQSAKQKVNTLLVSQEDALKAMTVSELTQRRMRLHAYQTQATLAEAKSYDRASKAQAPTSGVK